MNYCIYCGEPAKVRDKVFRMSGKEATFTCENCDMKYSVRIQNR